MTDLNFLQLLISVPWYMMTSSNENISASLAPCVGNSLVTGEFPPQRTVTRVFSLICAWINGWANNREAGDLTRRGVHHDVIVTMTLRNDEFILLYCVNIPYISYARWMSCSVNDSINNIACIFLSIIKQYSWIGAMVSHFLYLSVSPVYK